MYGYMSHLGFVKSPGKQQYHIEGAQTGQSGTVNYAYIIHCTLQYVILHVHVYVRLHVLVFICNKLLRNWGGESVKVKWNMYMYMCCMCRVTYMYMYM